MVNTVLSISGEPEAVIEIIRRLAHGAEAAALPAPAPLPSQAVEPTPDAAAPSAQAVSDAGCWNPDMVNRILTRVTEPSRRMIDLMLASPNYIVDVDEASERLQMGGRAIGGIRRSIGAAQNQLGVELPPVVIAYGRKLLGLNEDFAVAMTRLKQPSATGSRSAQWQDIAGE